MALDQQDSFEFHSRLLHSPGRPLTGGRTPDREQVGAVAISFIRQVPQRQSELLASWFWAEWVQVYNPCRVKTICIAAYSVMYISSSGFTSQSSSTHDISTSLQSTVLLGQQLRCGEREFPHQTRVGLLHSGRQETRSPECRNSPCPGVVGDIYILLAQKNLAFPWQYFTPLCIHL